MKCKYIVLALLKDGQQEESIFLFPSQIDHDRFLEGVLAIRFGHDRKWERSYRYADVLSAGFTDGQHCYGRSETLDLDSRPEQDIELLRKMLG